MHRIARMFLAALTFLRVLLMVPTAKPVSAGTVRYAKDGGLASGSCNSWANACTLQYALNSAAVSGDEIWVAGGTYKPHASDRTVSFVLKNGVEVYGGYAGTDSLRDIAAYPTILSGDIGAQGNSNDNSYHVVVGSGTDNTAVLDGVTITGGYANGTSPNDHGGGMFNQFGSPALMDVTFSDNFALWSGGGMFNSASSPTLENVTFSGNSAGTGGGMFNRSSDPTLTNVTFSGNSAVAGGGMYYFSGSAPKMTNVTFSGNKALAGDGGGVFNASSSPGQTLTNVTFSGNSAANGGGMFNTYSSPGPALTNVTFSGNSATNVGGGMYNESSDPILVNVIIAYSTNGGDCVNVTDDSNVVIAAYTLIEDANNSCVPPGSGTGNIIGSDPNLDPLADNGGPTETHALLTNSPAIDKGYCAPDLGVPPVDQRGVARPQGTGCDIGAFERYSGVYYVKPAATGNCTAWAAACNLQAALNASADGDQVWVAGGTYTPHRSDRTVSFVLKNGVEVYGGFAGTEDNVDQRDIAAYPTILSGDLKGDDQTVGTNAENAYHVVVGSSTDSTAVLDGVTITGGNACCVSSPNDRGGGMLNLSGSPTLENVTFSDNSALRFGGGLHNESSSNQTLTNVTFSGNRTLAGAGGGMYNESSSNQTLANVTFSANLASSGDGGGMHNTSSDPTLTNVTFSGNSAGNSGGGMVNISNSPALTNVTFSGNSASSGGGMSNVSSNLTLTNVTFSGNSATSNGGGMFNFDSSPTLINVIIANSTSGGDCVNAGTSTIHSGSSHNLIADGTNACGLIDDVNGNIIGQGPANLGPLADNGGATQTHALLTDSPAIDKGDNAACPAADQRGVTRPQGLACDIGAYEVARFLIFLPMVQR